MDGRRRRFQTSSASSPFVRVFALFKLPFMLNAGQYRIEQISEDAISCPRESNYEKQRAQRLWLDLGFRKASRIDCNPGPGVLDASNLHRSTERTPGKDRSCRSEAYNSRTGDRHQRTSNRPNRRSRHTRSNG